MWLNSGCAQNQTVDHPDRQSSQRSFLPDTASKAKAASAERINPWHNLRYKNMNLNTTPSLMGNSASFHARTKDVLGDFPPLHSMESTNAFVAAMNALPDFLRIQVSALVDATGAHPALALSTLLSGMAAGVHGRYLVQRENGDTDTLGLYMMILSGRTTGKSSVFRLVYEPHKAEVLTRYRAFKLAKQAARKQCRPEEDPMIDPGSGSARFREHLLQDVTKRGLLESLEGIGESVSIAAHDGESVLKTPLFRQNLSTLNELYDGKNASGIRRSGGELTFALDSSVNVLAMTQPEIARELYEYHGERARQIGFDARCLYAVVPPMRPHPVSSHDQAVACLAPYYERARTHLAVRLMRLEAGITDREVLVLSGEAGQLWTRLVSDHDQRYGGHYCHFQDAADRTPQNARRLAANIHAYSVDPGDISSEALYAGWMISQWFLMEFSCAFPRAQILAVKSAKLTPREKQQVRENEDCQLIIERIHSLCQLLGTESVSKDKVFARSGLYNARFRTAVTRVIDEGHVLETRVRNKLHLSLAAHVWTLPVGQHLAISNPK